jgi:hypothetical protein
MTVLRELITLMTVKKKRGLALRLLEIYLAKSNEAFYTQSFHKLKVAAMKIQS